MMILNVHSAYLRYQNAFPARILCSAVTYYVTYMYVCMMHRGLLEPYSYSAHLATYGGQTSVVDKNAFAHLI